MLSEGATGSTQVGSRTHMNAHSSRAAATWTEGARSADQRGTSESPAKCRRAVADRQAAEKRPEGSFGSTAGPHRGVKSRTESSACNGCWCTRNGQWWNHCDG